MIPGIVAGAMGQSGGGGNEAASILAKLDAWWALDEVSDGSSPVVREVSKASSVNDLTNSMGNVRSDTGRRGADVAAKFGTGFGRELLGTDGADAGEVGSVVAGRGMCWFGWAYFDTTANNQTLVSKTATGADSNTEYLIWTTSNKLRFHTGGGQRIIEAPIPSATAWHFVVAWVDDADMLLRISVDDGATYVSGSTAQYSAKTSSLKFGNWYTGTTFALSGRMQDWGFMGNGKFLSAAERTWLYNAGQGRTYAELVAAAGA